MSTYYNSISDTNTNLCLKILSTTSIKKISRLHLESKFASR